LGREFIERHGLSREEDGGKGGKRGKVEKGAKGDKGG
jgi:hypothetical protein